MNRIPINWALISNPANWVIVLLMVYIIGLALSLIFHRPNAVTQADGSS